MKIIPGFLIVIFPGLLGKLGSLHFQRMNYPGVKSLETAFVIYDGMTALDFVGVYDPLTRLQTMEFMPDFSWEICSFEKKNIKSHSGLDFTVTSCSTELKTFDLVVIPGGKGTRKLIKQREFINWLAGAAGSDLIASVCTGVLLVGAAGLLKDKKATTHPGAYDLLTEYCQEVSNDRIVDEGSIITAGGVSAALDLGLYLCEKIAGLDVREKIARQMDYRKI